MAFPSTHTSKHGSEQDTESIRYEKAQIGGSDQHADALEVGENNGTRVAAGNLTNLGLQSSTPSQYYLALQRQNPLAMVSTNEAHHNPTLSAVTFPSRLFPQGYLSPNFYSDPTKNATDSLQPSNNAGDCEIWPVSLTNSQSNETSSSTTLSQRSVNSSRNPQMAVLMHHNNALYLELEQLTNHNIQLANSNSALRAELHQEKENTIQMIQERHLRAQQALKQAKEYETLFANYKKSNEEIRELTMTKINGREKDEQDKNDELELKVLRRENNILRMSIEDLQEKNLALERGIKELSQEIKRSGRLMHEKVGESKIEEKKHESLKRQYNDLGSSDNADLSNDVETTNEVAPPVLKRSITKDAALPTKAANRQVTNDIVLPPSLQRKATSDLAGPTVNNRQVTIDTPFPFSKTAGMDARRNASKNYDSYHKIGRQASKLEFEAHYFQTQMDNAFSGSADQSKFMSLTKGFPKIQNQMNENGTSKFESSHEVKKFTRNTLDESEADLRDEDEMSSENVIVNGEMVNSRKKMHEVKNGKKTENSDKLEISTISRHRSPGNSSTFSDLLTASRSLSAKSIVNETKSEGHSEVNVVPPKRKRGRPKRDKSEGWPKRPLSAYNLFFREQRIRILDSLAPTDDNCDEKDEKDEKDENDQEGLSTGQCDDGSKRKRGRPYGSGKKRRRAAPHGIITFENLGKKISEDWKGAPDERKEKYRQQAAANLKKYQEDLEVFRREKKMREAMQITKDKNLSQSLINDTLHK